MRHPATRSFLDPCFRRDDVHSSFRRKPESSALAGLLLVLVVAIGCGGGGAGAPGSQAEAGSAASAPRNFGPEQHAALERAKALYAHGDYPEAFQAARKALTGGKESADAYSLISRLFIDTSQDQKGSEFFTLVAKDLGGAAGWYFAGYHAFRLNQWDEAAEDFRRAAEADPTQAEYRFRQGLVHQARGDFPAALEAIKTARELKPDSPLYAARLARLYRITGDYASAEKIVTDGLAKAPDSGELLYASAQLRLREGKTDEALALLRRALDLAPDLREAHYDLARALYQKGDRAGGDAAQRTFRRLSDDVEGLQSLSAKIGSRPNDASLLVTVADYHLTARRWAEALRTLTRAEAGGADAFRCACGRAEAHYGSQAPALGDEDLAAAEKSLGGKASLELQARLALARAAAPLARKNASAAVPLLAMASGPGAPPDKLFLMRVADAWRDIGRAAEARSLDTRAEALARPE